MQEVTPGADSVRGAHFATPRGASWQKVGRRHYWHFSPLYIPLDHLDCVCVCVCVCVCAPKVSLATGIILLNCIICKLIDKCFKFEF